MVREPKTLQDAIQYFGDPQNCHDYLSAQRWPDGHVQCPKCGSTNVTYYPKYRRFHCHDKHAAPQFTLKTGTVMEDSPIGLDKWLTATWQLVNCKNGISSYELHRAIGVTQKSAWFMLQRIRLALQDGSTVKLQGNEVEVDETFIGGKVRNMHKARKRRAQAFGRNGGKSIVLGMLDRNNKKVRVSVIPDRTQDSMHPAITANIARGTTVYSDEFANAWRMDDQYVHETVNHLCTYVNGKVHTNGMENFWSLLKRGLNGTYVSVEPFHLFRYVDEQAFRFNNRIGMDDGDRFSVAVSQLLGKRLTFAELTGKEGPYSVNQG